VIERRALVDEEGAGIQIGPNGSHILAVLGVLDHVQAAAGVPEAIHLHDGATGRDLASIPLGDVIAARHGAPYLVAHRADLHGALLAEARRSPLVRIETDWPSARVIPDREAVTVRSVDGRIERASLVVGADGLWSGLRGQLFPGRRSRPRPTGLSAMRTVISRSGSPLAEAGDVHVWMRSGAHVVHYPVRGGRELALVLIAPLAVDDDGWARPVEKALVEAAAARFPRPVRAGIAAGTAWRRHAIHRLAPLPSFASGRIALVGDAAHPMAPYMAQGAVMALEDAIVLARSIERHGATPAALERFSLDRRRRVQRVVRRSRLNGFVYHQRRPWSLVRNLILRASAGERLLASLDWLYGWRAPDD